MGKPAKKKRRMRYDIGRPRACDTPGSNCKIFEPNNKLARVVSGLTGEAIYEVVNRILARHLPAEARRAFNESAELGGEGG